MKTLANWRAGFSPRGASAPRATSGFTLLEVLVATVIMATAVVALLSNLSTSLTNAARLTDYDRAVLLAKRTMDDLLMQPNLPKMTVIEGGYDAEATGVTGGWRARVTPFERLPQAGPGTMGLDRLELEVWWMSGERRRTLALEGFRTTVLRQEDLAFGVGTP
jgi:general secretion pathway protein I